MDGVVGRGSRLGGPASCKATRAACVREHFCEQASARGIDEALLTCSAKVGKDVVDAAVVIAPKPCGGLVEVGMSDAHPSLHVPAGKPRRCSESPSSTPPLLLAADDCHLVGVGGDHRGCHGRLGRSPAQPQHEELARERPQHCCRVS